MNKNINDCARLSSTVLCPLSVVRVDYNVLSLTINNVGVAGQAHHAIILIYFKSLFSQKTM